MQLLYGVNGGVCSRNILARLETKHKLSGRTDDTILPQHKAKLLFHTQNQLAPLIWRIFLLQIKSYINMPSVSSCHCSNT